MTLYVGKLVRLRAFEPEDAPTVLGWLNDPEVQEYQGTRYPRSLDDIKDNRETAGIRFSSGNYAVEALDDGKLIGEVWIGCHHPEMRAGEVSITIGDRARWDRGYGSDTMRTVCRAGFEMMNLHRIELHVFSENMRARRAYQKVGFRLWRIERDLFSPARGYPEGLTENGIALRDGIWLEQWL